MERTLRALEGTLRALEGTLWALEGTLWALEGTLRALEGTLRACISGQKWADSALGGWKAGAFSADCDLPARLANAGQIRSIRAAMFPSDRRFPVKTAVLSAIAVLACGAIFIRLQIRKHPAADQVAPEPPLVCTTIELVRIWDDRQRLPERIRFENYSIREPREVPPQFILTVLAGERVKTQWLEIGEDIPDTEFRVGSFRKILANGADTSELTIVHKVTGAGEVLRVRDRKRGDLRAYFRGKAAPPGGRVGPEFSGRIGETFPVPSGNGTTCSVINIQGNTALVHMPDGTTKLLTAID